MRVLQSFSIGTTRYALVDETEKHDDRFVCLAGSSNFERPLLKFDSSLRIYDAQEKQIGWLMSDKRWFLIRFGQPDLDLQVDVNDFHWKNIELAEIAATKVLLS